MPTGLSESRHLVNVFQKQSERWSNFVNNVMIFTLTAMARYPLYNELIKPCHVGILAQPPVQQRGPLQLPELIPVRYYQKLFVVVTR